MKLDETLREQLAALAEGEGFELLDIEVTGSGPRTILRLVIDAPGGVTVDHCASVSRQASALLDVEDPFSHAYTLEVTSPGLDRKLYTRGDYHRFAAQRVKVRMQPTYRQNRVVVGTLLGLDQETVRVQTDAGDVAELPFDAIFETRIEVDWKSILDERKHRS